MRRRRLFIGWLACLVACFTISLTVVGLSAEGSQKPLVESCMPALVALSTVLTEEEVERLVALIQRQSQSKKNPLDAKDLDKKDRDWLIDLTRREGIPIQSFKSLLQTLRWYGVLDQLHTEEMRSPHHAGDLSGIDAIRLMLRNFGLAYILVMSASIMLDPDARTPARSERIVASDFIQEYMNEAGASPFEPQLSERPHR